jgi:hypothetical protein
MAEIPRNDRAAIKSDIALSRDRMGRELAGLRYEFDFPRKLKNSFRQSPLVWISVLAVVGMVVAVAPARRKKVYIQPEVKKNGKKGSGKGLLEAGALVGVLKFAATLLRPVILKYVTAKVGGYTRDRARATR